MAERLKPGLTGAHFQHPADRAGLRAVVETAAGVLGRAALDRLMREAEDDFYQLNLADNTKLGPAQGAALYRLVEDVAGVLGVPTPHVFLDSSPGHRAKTLGGATACLVLPSGLVDALPDPALRAAVGHELGHVLCGHSFWRLLAENFEALNKLAGAIPWVGPLVAGGVQLALFDWYRKAALSADRAALLATQDLGAVQHNLLWAAGGASRIGADLSADGLRAQAEELQAVRAQKRAGGVVDRVGYLLSAVVLQQAWSAHPWPAVRFVEITGWAESDQYKALLAGDYDKAAAAPADGEATAPLTAGLGRAAADKLKGLFKRRSDPPAAG